MFVVVGLMHPFKALFGAAPANRAAYPMTYAVMLALSVLLGYLVARLFSEPLNRALRDRFAAEPSRPLEAAPG
jgi:peptidoglycan/LPS O-acetylase OafA/YrhL